MDKQKLFIQELWAFKRRERTTEPHPAEFGIDPILGEVLARQVQLAFEQSVIKKAVA